MKLTTIGTALTVSGLLFLASCGGGGGSSSPPVTEPDPPTTEPDPTPDPDPQPDPEPEPPVVEPPLSESDRIKATLAERIEASHIVTQNRGGSFQWRPIIQRTSSWERFGRAHVQGRQLRLADLNSGMADESEYRQLESHGGMSLAQGQRSTTRRGEFAGPDEHSWNDELNVVGWLRHSLFHVGEFAAGSTEHAVGPYTSTFSEIYSIGVWSGTNPTSGSATWTGSMAGIDHARRVLGELSHRVRGAATITIDDFSAPSVDVSFTRVVSTSTGEGQADMVWNDLPLTGGTFRGDELVGHFYGPNQEEAGGVFRRDQISGAFGATRQ